MNEYASSPKIKENDSSEAIDKDGDMRLLNDTTPNLYSGFYKLIYVFSGVDSPNHEGMLKVGDATIHTTKNWRAVTQEELEEAARNRIDSYTRTTEFKYKLEHVEIAIIEGDENANVNSKAHWDEGFRDYAVHRVLTLSGFEKSNILKDKKTTEWFHANLDQVKAAIEAVKNRKDFIIERDTFMKIVLRPEQDDAVKKTLKEFKKSKAENCVHKPKKVLWNAKMRFGKTLTSYSLLKAMAERDETVNKVLIVTHHPDVNDAWSGDFVKSGLLKAGWSYGSKKNKSKFEETSINDKFIWFASIQDLRGSHDQDALEDSEGGEIVLTKNQELFGTHWDLVITDEVHSGTMTELAKTMYKNLESDFYLDLSGTPFNVVNAAEWSDPVLVERFNYDYQYNWSYIDERRAKKRWDEENPGEVNPYAGNPEIKFVTYDVSESISNLKDDTSAIPTISFSKFFETRVDENGEHEFVHEQSVTDFLDKLRGARKYSTDPENFPYSKKYNDHFRHTLWMLPNVGAVNAMEKLLSTPASGFAGYGIVNATGEGTSSWKGERGALEAVRKTINSHKYTITLSQQMLTTGVTVPEWTGVFMMNNTTSPMLYMQTAFRGASSGSLPDGRVKETAYVFDFNPDRCLREIVALVQSSMTDEEKDPNIGDTLLKANLSEQLEYMSLLSLEGSKFIQPNSDEIMKKLNDFYLDEIVEQGFYSPRIWNNETLAKFDIQKQRLMEAIRIANGGKKRDGITVSEFTDEERARLKELEKKRKEEQREDSEDAEKLSKEEKAQLADLKKKKDSEEKNRKNAISILSSIAVRMPMLIFASLLSTEITPENFNLIIDDESWREIMPKYLLRIMPEGTKPLEERLEALEGTTIPLYWDDVKIFFNQTMFTAAAERIRKIAREADECNPVERALRIVRLFGTFRNPDKETVLTPARVVALQYANTLGGYNFFDLERSTTKEDFVKVRHVAADVNGDRIVESVPIAKAIEMTANGEVRMYAPKVKVDEALEGFWSQKDFSVYDINSKTALYPLYATMSRFIAWMEEFKNTSDYAIMRKQSNAQELIAAKENNVWKYIVENEIFVNCRVPYSALIAQRVLGRYAASPDENGEIQTLVKANTTVIDVMKLKKAFSDWNSLRKVERPANYEKINVHKKIGEALRLANSRFLEVKAPELYATLVSTGIDKNLGKIIERFNEGNQTMTDVQDLINYCELHKEKLPKFAAVVSNPPYQENLTEETSKAKPSWPDFVYVTSYITNKASFINPARWQRGGAGTGLLSIKEYFFESKHLHKFLTFPDHKVFPNVGIGDICIEFLDFEKELDHPISGIENDGVMEYREYIPNDLIDIVLKKESEVIILKILEAKIGPNFEKELWIGGQDNRTKREASNPLGHQQMDYGIVGQRMFKDNDYFINKSEKLDGIDYLKIYYSPKISTVDTKYLPLSEMQDTPNNNNRISRWQVLIPKTNANFFYRNLGPIAEPNSLCTNTWVCRSFDSKLECENYQSYLKTIFYRFLVSSRIVTHIATGNIHRFVPDLVKLTNPRTGLIGYESDWTDDDLKILFKDVLTDEDWAYIEKTAIESDPAGIKKSKG